MSKKKQEILAELNETAEKVVLDETNQTIIKTDQDLTDKSENLPKVSVIFTSFNHEQYICEAIESVLKQTFSNFELIIWDDASKDDSWHLINQFTDARIKAFRNEVNKGPVFGINKAITEIAKGDYIAIHHSDDVWELNKLEKQIEFLDVNQEIGAVFTCAKIIDEQSQEIPNDYFIQENKSRWQWLQQLFTGDNRLNHPSLLIRKQCYQEVGLYRDNLAQTPDAEMWSRLLLKFPIHIIQEKLTKHRLCSDDSNTSGYRIDVKIRTNNEWNNIRENFLLLNDFDDIVAIFPSLERYRNPAGFDNKFLLAMACLHECKQRNAWQLGLTWLFELLNDKATCQKIANLYAFSYADLIKLTAEFDVYGIESLSVFELQTQIENLQTNNAWLESRCQAWEKTASEREQFIEDLRTGNEDLRTGNAWLESQLVEWKNVAIKHEEFIEELRTGNAWLDSQLTAWKNAAAKHEAFIEELKTNIEFLKNNIEFLNTNIEELRVNSVLLESQRATWENIAAERIAIINAIYASHSWKITRPLRFLVRLIKEPMLLSTLFRK